MHTPDRPSQLANAVKARAAELGFCACGITTAAPARSYGRLIDWLGRGYHATMGWMARPDALLKRSDSRRLLPGARSVICVAMHYRTGHNWDEESHGKVAMYARGTDYHEVLSARLCQLLDFLRDSEPCSGRVYVDAGPLLERELAQLAGLGWIGKNTMLMSRGLGSYFLLGEIVTDLLLPPDRPHIEEYCGSCTRCLDACPTDAFVAPYVLDANRCISYHTIENRKSAPRELQAKFGDWLFGCDICQEVCPWNNKSQAQTAEPELWQRDEFPTLLESLMMPQAEFARRLKGSPLKRAKRRGLRRNALNVLKNRRDSGR